MNVTDNLSGPDFPDAFPQSPARDAVVAVVRGYGMVQRLMGPYFSRFGLTPPQFQVLTVLRRLRGRRVTQRRLAAALYVSFPNVTVLLGRLEKARLIRRRGNPEDRREKFVALTRRGRKLLNQIWKEHQDQLERVVAGLSAAEQARLARLLHKMIAAHAGSAANEAGLEKQKM